nr:phenylalanine--tRNA ligase alpha subunit, cytoplasmic-like [Ipomoea batatas]
MRFLKTIKRHVAGQRHGCRVAGMHQSIKGVSCPRAKCHEIKGLTPQGGASKVGRAPGLTEPWRQIRLDPYRPKGRPDRSVKLVGKNEASVSYSKEMAEDAVLGFLEKNEEILDSGKFSEEKGISHDEMVNAINSLNGFGFVIAQDIKSERWVLTDEGKIYATAGSPEVQLFLAIPPEGITQEELQKKYPAIFKVGWPQAMKNKWVEKGKSNVSRKVQNVDDTVKDLLMQIQNGEAVDPKDIDGLKRRKLIAQQSWKGYSVRKGPKYAPKRIKEATDLTRENLHSFLAQPGDAFDSIVREFYANAKDGVETHQCIVRGVAVNFSPAAINAYYGTTNHGGYDYYHKDLRPGNITQADLDNIAHSFHQDAGWNIKNGVAAPHWIGLSLTSFGQSSSPIHIGETEIAQTEAKTHCFLGHPSLITELCRRAGVPILENQEVRLPPQLYLSQHDIQTRYGQGQFPDPDDAENEDQANDEAMEDPAPAAHAPDQFPP